MDQKEFLSFLDSFAKGDVIDKVSYFDAKTGQTRIVIDNYELHIDRSQILFVLNSLDDPDPEVVTGSVRLLSLLCTPSLRLYISDAAVYKAVIKALTNATDHENPEIQQVAKRGLEIIKGVKL